MLQVKDELKGLDIEINLTEEERAVLAASVKQRGFEIMQRIMEDQVRKFNFNLLNTDPSKQDAVIAAHSLAKAVAQFYTSLMEKIESECQIHVYSNRRPVIQDATEIPELQ